MSSLSRSVRSFKGANVYFGLFLSVENMFISYLFILSNFLPLEYNI